MDSREHAIHLRLVHFTVVATSLGLAVAASLDTSGDAKRAYQDLQKILALNEKVLEKPNWYLDHANVELEAIRKEPEWTEHYPRQITVQTQDEKYKFRLNLRTPWTLRGPHLRDLSKDSYRTERTDSLSTPEEFEELDRIRTSCDMVPIENLEDFMDLWDYLASHAFVYAAELIDTTIGTKCGTHWPRNDLGDEPGGGNPQPIVIFDEAGRTGDGSDDDAIPETYPLFLMPIDDVGQLDAADNTADSSQAKDYTHILSTLDMNKMDRVHDARRIDVPVRCVAHALGTQRYLTSEAVADWHPGDFERTFPALARLTSELAPLPLDNLEVHLKAVQDKEKSRFQVLSMAIPSEALSPWGIGILATIQLYFLLHLRTLGRRISDQDDAWSVPWLVLYPGRVERLVSILSTLAVPPVAAGYVAVRTEILGGTPSTTASIVAASIIVVASYTLAFYTWGEESELWRKCTPRHAPAEGGSHGRCADESVPL